MHAANCMRRAHEDGAWRVRACVLGLPAEWGWQGWPCCTAATSEWLWSQKATRDKDPAQKFGTNTMKNKKGALPPLFGGTFGVKNKNFGWQLLQARLPHIRSKEESAINTPPPTQIQKILLSSPQLLSKTTSVNAGTCFKKFTKKSSFKTLRPLFCFVFSCA